MTELSVLSSRHHTANLPGRHRARKIADCRLRKSEVKKTFKKSASRNFSPCLPGGLTDHRELLLWVAAALFRKFVDSSIRRFDNHHPRRPMSNSTPVPPSVSWKALPCPKT